MSIYDVLLKYDSKTLLTGAATIIAALMSVVQVSKIEINPWSWVWDKFTKGLKSFGKITNEDLINTMNDLSNKTQDLTNRVVDLSEEMQSMKLQLEEDKAKECRIRILMFGDELRTRQQHTKEHFDEILHEISLYEHYCNTHPQFENDKAVLTIEYIENIYKKCLEENSFL